MVARVLLAVIAASAASCHRSGPSAKEPARTDGAGTTTTLILYRDLAELRLARSVTFDAGGRASIEGAPPGSRLSVRGADGAPLEVDRVLPRKPGALVEVGERILVVTDSARVAGRFEAWTRRGVLLQTDRGPRIVSGELRLIGLDPAQTPATLHLEGGRAGQKRDIIISTWLEHLAWRVAYTAVLADDGKHAHLHGWLSIDAPRGAEPVRLESLMVVDGKAEPPAPGTNRKGSRPTTIVSLPLPTVLPPGGSVRLPIMRGPRAVPVVVTRVFDPIGRGFGHQGVVPIRRPAYGTQHDRKTLPVSLTIELDLDDDRLEALPAGPVSLFARGNGTIRALGVTEGFGVRGAPPRDLLSDGAAAASRVQRQEPPRAGELRIGVAPGLSGRRWQEEITGSERQRRLVEEIRVELSNDTEQDAPIEVIEHMVRGLNWSLAYHNKVGVAAKRGPQEVRFSVNVRANTTVLLMYRVVYTW